MIGAEVVALAGRPAERDCSLARAAASPRSGRGTSPRARDARARPDGPPSSASGSASITSQPASARRASPRGESPTIAAPAPALRALSRSVPGRRAARRRRARVPPQRFIASKSAWNSRLIASSTISPTASGDLCRSSSASACSSRAAASAYRPSRCSTSAHLVVTRTRSASAAARERGAMLSSSDRVALVESRPVGEQRRRPERGGARPALPAERESASSRSAPSNHRAAVAGARGCFLAGLAGAPRSLRRRRPGGELDVLRPRGGGCAARVERRRASLMCARAASRPAPTRTPPVARVDDGSGIAGHVGRADEIAARAARRAPPAPPASLVPAATAASSGSNGSPDDRGASHDEPGLFRKIAELLRQRGRDRGGHLDARQRRSISAAARTRELLEVERIAAALGIERRVVSPTAAPARPRASAGPARGGSNQHSASRARVPPSGARPRDAAGLRTRSAPALPAACGSSASSSSHEPESAQCRSSRISTSGWCAARRSRSARTALWPR